MTIHPHGTVDAIKRRVLDALPDEPRWVETRDLLRCARSSIVASRDGSAFVVWSEADRLASIVGAPDAVAVASAAGVVPQLLAFDENIEEVKAMVPRFAAERALVFSSPDVLAASPPHSCRPLDARSLIQQHHLPADLMRELRDVAEGGALVVGAFDGERAVSFAYVAAESESLWDVSIDTLESHRRQGYASAAILSLMRQMQPHGKAPVWGALESNHASAGLARRLGFVACDALWVLTRGEE